jgi:hypothetical protein
MTGPGETCHGCKYQTKTSWLEIIDQQNWCSFLGENAKHLVFTAGECTEHKSRLLEFEENYLKEKTLKELKEKINELK